MNNDPNYKATLVLLDDFEVHGLVHFNKENFDEEYFKSITSENPVIVDIKGIYRNKIKTLTYWSL